MDFLADLIVLSLLVKLLLFPAYKSTDFEVHRNWLRITFNQSPSTWYYDTLSDWTLDYPPFFAWFERVLSGFARFFDPGMLEPDSLDYDSWRTVLFQRLSVLASEIVFLFAIYKYANGLIGKWKSAALAFVFLQFGYLVVDNIHFQYNSALEGILVLSVYYCEKGRFIKSAVLFATLLNFKHIYLYCAPAFFFYLLRNYCFENSRFKIGNFTKLGGSVIAVFLVSLFPFREHIPQLISRLFPLQRGLTHAYWAPNVWAIYCFMNRVLEFSFRKLGFAVTVSCIAKCELTILPEITASHTVILVILASIFLWRQKRGFTEFCAIQSLIFFLFAFHAHEKAALIPLTLLQLESFRCGKHATTVFLFSFVSGVTLLPLIPWTPELFFVILLFLAYHIAYYLFLTVLAPKPAKFGLVAWFIVILGSFLAISLLTTNLLEKQGRISETFISKMLISLYGAAFNIGFAVWSLQREFSSPADSKKIP